MRCHTILAIAAVGSLMTGGAHALELSSPSIATGYPVSADQVKDGCGGKNVSPALSWKDAPGRTKSFALTVFDPDAHGGWWHWIVIDIPASASSLRAGSAPQATQLANDFGDKAYDGPCPPPGSGAHHYEFTLWALPVANIPPADAASTARLSQYLKTHALAQAQIIGLYQR